MASDKLNDLLVDAVEKVAGLDDFPSDWKNWEYWEDEKKKRWNSRFPSPWRCKDYIEEINRGNIKEGGEFFVYLVERIFDSSEYEDVEKHPLWELTLRISQHPSLNDSDRKEFFHYCSDENLYLKTFSFESMLLEKPHGGKVIEINLSVPENTEQDAESRARDFMESESDQLAKRFSFQHSHSFELGQTLGSGWASEPQKNEPVRILSTDVM